MGGVEYDVRCQRRARRSRRYPGATGRPPRLPPESNYHSPGTNTHLADCQLAVSASASFALSSVKRCETIS
mgnify:CR=1 FL=1